MTQAALAAKQELQSAALKYASAVDTAVQRDGTAASLLSSGGLDLLALSPIESCERSGARSTLLRAAGQLLAAAETEQASGTTAQEAALQSAASWLLQPDCAPAACDLLASASTSPAAASSAASVGCIHPLLDFAASHASRKAIVAASSLAFHESAAKAFAPSECTLTAAAENTGGTGSGTNDNQSATAEILSETLSHVLQPGGDATAVAYACTLCEHLAEHGVALDRLVELHMHDLLACAAGSSSKQTNKQLTRQTTGASTKRGKGTDQKRVRRSALNALTSLVRAVGASAAEAAADHNAGAVALEGMLDGIQPEAAALAETLLAQGVQFAGQLISQQSAHTLAESVSEQSLVPALALGRLCEQRTALAVECVQAGAVDRLLRVGTDLHSRQRLRICSLWALECIANASRRCAELVASHGGITLLCNALSTGQVRAHEAEQIQRIFYILSARVKSAMMLASIISLGYERAGGAAIVVALRSLSEVLHESADETLDLARCSMLVQSIKDLQLGDDAVSQEWHASILECLAEHDAFASSEREEPTPLET